MLYMNEYDIAEALRLHSVDPVLSPATRTLPIPTTWFTRHTPSRSVTTPRPSAAPTPARSPGALGLS